MFPASPSTSHIRFATLFTLLAFIAFGAFITVKYMPRARAFAAVVQNTAATTSSNRPDVFWMRGRHQQSSLGVVYAPNGNSVFALVDNLLKMFRANQPANLQSSTPLCIPPPAGLTAWYKGDGNALDSSGNGVTGTLDGSVNGGVTFAPGKVGQAFNFDGVDDRVAIPDAPSNSPSSALTLDARINPARVNQQQVFISKYNNATSQDAFTLNSDVTGSKLQFRVYQTGDSGGHYRIIETTNSVLSVNVWTHVAATFDTATQAMKIYANGVDMPTTVIETNGTITSIFNSIEPIRLGDFINGAGNHVLFFQGLLDEAQIYNRALSASEIQTIYQSGSASVYTGSVYTPNFANGKIAFEYGHIYTSDADGSNLTQLTSYADHFPKFSFDGSKIVFQSVRDGNGEIYIMNADGTNQVRLTNNSAYDNQTPGLSPDGSKITYSRVNPSPTGRQEIYVMNADGTNQVQLTHNDAYQQANLYSSNPSFSPDGRKILSKVSKPGM